MASQEVNGTFTLMRGQDTLLVEGYTRTDAMLRSELRAKGGPRTELSAALRPDHTVRQITGAIYAPGSAAGAAPVRGFVGEFQKDTLVVQLTSGAAPPQTRRVAVPANTMPMGLYSVSLMELLLHRARAMGTQATVPAVALETASAYTAQVTFTSPTEARVEMPNTVVQVTLDAAGRILRAQIPAQNIIIERSPGAPR